MRLMLAQVHSFPTCGRTEKRRPPRPANMDFNFIDFAPRRSYYGSNHFRRVMETKMSFRLPLILATVLAAWSAAASGETIKIGVTPGPHAQIFEAVKPIAAKQGLDIQLIEFSDYVVPNAALDAGEIQAN